MTGVGEAKARLLDYGQTTARAQKAKGPTGTLAGKAVLVGAAAALLAGLIIGKPIGKMLRRKARPTRQWWRPPVRGEPWHDWMMRTQGRAAAMREQAHERDERGSSGRRAGASMPSWLRMCKPLLPLAAQYAGRWYLKRRMARRPAAPDAVVPEEHEVE